MTRFRILTLRRALCGLTLSFILAACDGDGALRPAGPDMEDMAGTDTVIAQDPPARDTLRIVEAPPRTCTMQLGILMARLVDAAGRPVEGAEVEVSRPDGLSARVSQIDAIRLGTGMHMVFTDGLLPLEADGTWITAHFRKDGKTHAQEYRLGHDGCHFFLLAAPPDTVRTGW